MELKRRTGDWKLYGQGIRNWFESNMASGDYREFLATLRGFNDHADLLTFLAMRKGFDSYPEYNAWLNNRRFHPPEQTIECTDDDVIDQMYLETKRTYTQDLIIKLKEIIQILPEKYAAVIIARFYEGKTSRQIGLELGFTHQNIYRIEKIALRRLYEEAKQSGLYEMYIGED